MRVAPSLLGLILCAGCSSGASDPASLAQADLTRGDWRLFASVFPALPAEGYPITFCDDGSVETDNLALVELWQMQSVDQLLLTSHADGGTDIRYVFVRDTTGAFVATTGPGTFVIAPRGADVDRYFRMGSPE